MIKISVVIPVKNGEATLDKCLQSIRNQTLSDAIEIIVLDSMSTDRSREIALKYNAIIIPIAEGSFNHGLTRNKGVMYANAELVYLTVQDAWIAETDMLERMMVHFEEQEIVAVCGHQAVPHERDKNPVFWQRTFSYPEIKRKEPVEPEAFNALPAQIRKELIAWDNVVAMYRKITVLQQPFVPTSFAEDWIWCHQALLNGSTMIYDPSLVVYHYHHSTFIYTFRVNYMINYQFYSYFQLLPSPVSMAKPFIKRTYHLLRNNNLSFKEQVYWILHNAGMLAAHKLSVLDFLVRLKAGGKSCIDKGYRKYCIIIPQGSQKQSKL